MQARSDYQYGIQRCQEKTVRTEILLRPHPIHSSFPLPFPPNAPPVVNSRRAAGKGRTRSVAMYTCVSVSTESMYLILQSASV